MNKDHVIVDIDGVLADYRLGLLWWVNKEYPELRSVCKLHLQRTDTWLKAETMGVTYRDWLEILEHFRLTGGKQTIPLFPHAKAMLDYFRFRKWRIVLLTSRPIDIYSTIYRDTVEWLRQNELPYDLILWSKNKDEMCHRLRLVDVTRFAIDDEVSHIDKYHKLGMPTYWINHYLKESAMYQGTNVHVVKNLQQIIKEEENARKS